MSKVGTIVAGTAVAALLAACQPYASAPGDPGATPETPDRCGAGKVTKWTGQADSPAMRDAIAKASGAKSIRWLTPGMAVTMDYRQDRLNANIDASGKYTGFHCA